MTWYATGCVIAFYPLRFYFTARRPLHLPAGQAANLLRGGFGKALYRGAPEVYRRIFAPASSTGPSGFRDAPRPFVFRVTHLEGVQIAPAECFWIGMNLFETREDLIGVIGDALRDVTGADLASVEGASLERLPLEPASGVIRRVRVSFLTPTELKGADQPEFGALFARIRDRVSTLRALYGAGPLQIDFAALGERAREIRMTRCELQHVDRERVSRGTGRRHPLGGFTGVAEYQGDLAEFVPYLEAARFTGVGRQTVWGNGEIACEVES